MDLKISETVHDKSMNTSIYLKSEPEFDIEDEIEDDLNDDDGVEMFHSSTEADDGANHFMSIADNEILTCPSCGKESHDKASYNLHVIEHHINGEKTKYECLYCDRVLRDKSKLKEHLRNHTGERPFVCYCGSAFNRKEHLVRHQYTHTDTRPHQCTMCTKSFTERAKLLRHEQTHLGVKPYKCPITSCARDYAKKESCQNHIKRMHPFIENCTPITISVSNDLMDTLKNINTQYSDTINQLMAIPIPDDARLNEKAEDEDVIYINDDDDEDSLEVVSEKQPETDIDPVVRNSELRKKRKTKDSNLVEMNVKKLELDLSTINTNEVTIFKIAK